MENLWGGKFYTVPELKVVRSCYLCATILSVMSWGRCQTPALSLALSELLGEPGVLTAWIFGWKLLTSMVEGRS